ncbi:MAG: hypothetical protein KC505_00485 [Myxococcales bacterium]|nr:hypothetical protein [Myxococcales bacterium]USN50169.1 MAG: hypothetical protein H6731_07825 [Myxococcales bacterium]
MKNIIILTCSIWFATSIAYATQINFKFIGFEQFSKNPAHKILEVNCSNNTTTTIGDLKEQFFYSYNISPSETIILIAHEKLEDSALVSSVNIAMQGEVMVVRDTSGGINCFSEHYSKLKSAIEANNIIYAENLSHSIERSPNFSDTEKRIAKKLTENLLKINNNSNNESPDDELSRLLNFIEKKNVINLDPALQKIYNNFKLCIEYRNVQSAKTIINSAKNNKSFSIEQKIEIESWMNGSIIENNSNFQPLTEKNKTQILLEKFNDLKENKSNVDEAIDIALQLLDQDDLNLMEMEKIRDWINSI